MESDRDIDRILTEQGLTEKQKRFVNHLLEDPSNATRAAILAGYAKGSARVTASRLLDHPAVQAQLKAHFINQQGPMVDILTKTLTRVNELLNAAPAPSGDAKLDYLNTSLWAKNVLKAGKLAVDLARLHTNVLGLDLKGKKRPFELSDLTPEEMVAQHLAEVQRLNKLINERNAGETPGPAPAAGEGQVSH